MQTSRKAPARRTAYLWYILLYFIFAFVFAFLTSCGPAMRGPLAKRHTLVEHDKRTKMAEPERARPSIAQQ